MSDTLEFLHTYCATGVGDTPPQPLQAAADEPELNEKVLWDVEQPAAAWTAIIVPEAPAITGEHPERFIDGSQRNLPVLCVRPPQGYPIPLVVAEAGAIALRLTGRRFVRDFVCVERFLGMVAEPFPWDHVERFAADLANRPDLQLRLTPANMPRENSPFDYEVMRNQTHQRLQQEMLNLERLALAADDKSPALMDGMIAGAIHTKAAAARPLLVGVVKRMSAALLHDTGLRLLQTLRPGQRTPVMKLTGVSGENGHEADMPRASWFSKLAGGPRLAPNWGFVRVDIPWVQFTDHFHSSFDFVNRLSRWLIDARCRAASYARMPVSLEPIVRAEDLLKPLFTPLPALATRLARQAGDIV